ncbi:MFS transporter [Rubrobacter tropicus]|uniref:MFS transporter n=1 Tax=Rubrobacter tropicus TaxID=2653851 RepID=A0A6G8QC95_9ACTN|nr:MFS transporter [Rubrobacter tropicus]
MPEACFRYHRLVFLRAAKAFRGFDRRVWLLLFAMVAFRFGHGLYFPFSSIYFHNVLGIPLSLVGVGLAVFAASSVVSGLVAGPLTDRYGRKPTMLVALCGSSASFFGFALIDGFAGYLAVSAAHGLLGWSMFEASRNAMVADVTQPGARSRAYGLVRVGGNVGWAAGPMVAGLVSAAAAGSAGVYPKLFVGTSVLTALVALALALTVRESLPSRREAGTGKRGKRGLREAFTDGPFVLLLGVGVLLYYVFTQDWQALPIYAKNFVGATDGQIGFFLGANGLMVILFQLPVSYLIDRGSKVMALLAGATLFALSSATLLLTESFVGIVIAFVLFFTLAEMVLEVAGAALAAEIAPVHLRGTYLALFGACFGAACGVSPIVGGALLQAELPDVIWTIQLVAALIAVSGLLVLAALRRELVS